MRGFTTVCFYFMFVWLQSHNPDDPANGNLLFPRSLLRGSIPALRASLSVCKGFPSLCEQAAFIFPREAMLYRSSSLQLCCAMLFSYLTGTVAQTCSDGHKESSLSIACPNILLLKCMQKLIQ
jgi:hypothetical protein